MTPVVGKVHNGKIEIVAPSEFSEGAEVRVWLDTPIPNDDGRITSEEIERTLAEREPMEPEPELDTETIARFRALIEQSKGAKCVG